MLAFPPSYAIPISLVFIGIVSLFLYPPLRERVRPRRVLILALVATLVCLPIHVINYQQVEAYDVGNVVFRWTWNFTVSPGDVERIDNVSNIHTIASAYVMVICNNSVTFYLTDQNTPETHYLEANYSEEYVGFRLPYLYTETGVPARWSVCLRNPTPDFLNVTIESIWLEDNIEIARWSIQYNLYLPLALLFAVWMALGTPLLIIHRKRIKSQGFMIGLFLTILGVSIGLVLATVVPLFLYSPGFIAVFLIIPLILFFRSKPKEAPEGPSVDVL